MTIDYIEKITLREKLKNVKEQLKTVQDENAELKTTIATLTAAIYKLSEEKQWERDYLAKQVEHLQSCLDLEKNKE